MADATTSNPTTSSPAKRAAGSRPTAKKGVKRVTRDKKVIRKPIGKAAAPSKRTVNIYDLEGNVLRSVPLPAIFDEPLRPDLIRRAVTAAQANRRQPYGPSKTAGMMHAVSTWGKGRGVARVQRLSQGRRAAESPNNVGGRRAHPPTPEKRLGRKINRKERRKARNSALYATSVTDLVRGRGHRFRMALTLPVVASDELETVSRTQNVLDIASKLGIYPDLRRSDRGRHVRAGRGKRRGRKYRIPRSVLFVVSEYRGLEKAINNLPGTDIITPQHLNTELLAPGGDFGRLTVWTESALKQVGEW